MKKRLKNENEKQKRKRKKKERKLRLATNAWRIDEMIIMMNMKMKMIHYLMKNAIVMERGIGREGKREERK
jgi:hypothetical protein